MLLKVCSNMNRYISRPDRFQKTCQVSKYNRHLFHSNLSISWVNIPSPGENHHAIDGYKWLFFPLHHAGRTTFFPACALCGTVRTRQPLFRGCAACRFTGFTAWVGAAARGFRTLPGLVGEALTIAFTIFVRSRARIPASLSSPDCASHSKNRWIPCRVVVSSWQFTMNTNCTFWMLSATNTPKGVFTTVASGKPSSLMACDSVAAF